MAYYQGVKVNNISIILGSVLTDDVRLPVSVIGNRAKYIDLIGYVKSSAHLASEAVEYETPVYEYRKISYFPKVMRGKL